jgi:hypothetical protein
VASRASAGHVSRDMRCSAMSGSRWEAELPVDQAGGDVFGFVGEVAGEDEVFAL